MKRSLLPLLLLALATPAFAGKKKAKTPETPPPEPAPVVDPEAWRAKPPGPGPASAWTPPAASVVTLDNGIPVYVVENQALPLANVVLVMKVGRETNPKGKAGLSALTANLLDEGTRTRNAEQIAATAASLGAELSVQGGDEYAAVVLKSLGGEPLAPSLDLLADVALNPKFDKATFARVKAEILADIQDEKSEPRMVAYRVALRELWGADHPYGTPAIGDEKSIGAIQAGDPASYYKTWWHAGNAAFVVTGALTPAQAKDMLNARFGKWAKGTSQRPAVTPPAVPLKTRVVFVEQPGAVQSVLRVVTPGPARTSPEFMSANVAGTIVGGMFSSRINMNLREEHGWSYGAYGGFSENRDHGVFGVRASVQADKTAPAITEILKELKGAAAAAPSKELLVMAQDSIGKALPGNFETNVATATAFMQIPQFGLPADAWQTYNRDLYAVTADAALEMAKKYFDPSRLVVVVVGPRSVEVDDGQGGRKSVDVVAELKGLGFEYVER